MSPWHALLLFLALLAGEIHAQSDTVTLHDVRYPNGKRSAWAYYLKSTQEGRATCYLPNGTQLYSGTISHRHGDRSVEFKHHGNKVVSQIHEHSAPDAGIQWYNRYLEYDEAGTLIRTWENNWDDMVTLRNPIIEPAPSPVVPVPVTPNPKPQPEVVECAVLYSNRSWFINATPFHLMATYVSRGDTIRKPIAPGDTVMMGNQVQAQFFESPMKSAGFSAVATARKGRKFMYEFQPAGEQKKSGSEMDFYYRIRGVLK